MAMMIENLDARGVREAIKRGLGVDGLCERYGCEAEALFLRIQHVYKHNHAEMIQRLRESGRKVSGVKIKNAASRAPAVVKDAAEETISDTNAMTEEVTTIIETIENKEATLTAQKNLEATTKVAETLDALKEEEATLSKSLMETECDYEVVLNQHRAQIALLRDVQDDLKKIETQFNEKMASYQKIVKEDDGLVDTLNGLMAVRREKATKLAELRNQIRELEITTICAYENGTIEVFEGPEITIDKSGASEIFAQLVERAECENLRVREIKLVSEVIAAMQHAPGVNVIIENPAVAEVYETLMEHIDDVLHQV